MRTMLLILSVTLTGCAGAQLQKEWTEQRGYTDAEMALIRPHAAEYQKTVAWGMSSSTAFNSAPSIEAERRVRTIYCACIKKLGSDRCRKKPEGLSEADKELWAKGNAAEMALVSMSYGAPGRQVDPAECI